MVIGKIRNYANVVTKPNSTNVPKTTNSASLATTNRNGTTKGIEGSSRIPNQPTDGSPSPSSVLQAGTFKNALAFTKPPLVSRTKANLNAISPEFNGRRHGTNNHGNSGSSGNAFGDISNATITDAETDETEDSLYECNICLDTAHDAVVSMCGHLFCWQCLDLLLTIRPDRKQCPVCKAYVDKNKVIPLFGRNCVNKVDPRYKVPIRPAGQRFGFNFGNMSRPAAVIHGITQFQNAESQSKLFIFLSIICLLWILFT